MKNNPALFLLFMLALSIAGCMPGSTNESTETNSTPQKPLNCIEESYFGSTAEGDSASLFTMKNKNGLVVKLSNYGGIITEIRTPDRNGKAGNIVLGFDNLEQYLAGHPYFEAIVGRYANRIAHAMFSLDGETFSLAANNGNNHLHGGLKGFDKVVWDAKPVVDPERCALKLTYLSPDGEEGYPGNLELTVSYELLDDRLIISYNATSDKATPLNLTNHSYFNLAGTGDVLDHILYINASRYTPSDENLIPTGELAYVEGTPFDFRKPHPIGARLQEAGGNPIGYDHNFVIDGKEKTMVRCAKVMDPGSGRFLEVSTTEPGLQFYTGNFLDGSLKSGERRYEQYSGFCLETQHFPDSPNQPNFPGTILRPGERYESQTIFRFGVED